MFKKQIKQTTLNIQNKQIKTTTKYKYIYIYIYIYIEMCL